MKTAHSLSQSTIRELTRVVLTYKLLTRLDQSLASKATLIESVLQIVCFNDSSLILLVRYQHLDGCFSEVARGRAQVREVKVKEEETRVCTGRGAGGG